MAEHRLQARQPAGLPRPEPVLVRSLEPGDGPHWIVTGIGALLDYRSYPVRGRPLREVRHLDVPERAHHATSIRSSIPTAAPFSSSSSDRLGIGTAMWVRTNDT